RDEPDRFGTASARRQGAEPHRRGAEPRIGPGSERHRMGASRRHADAGTAEPSEARATGAAAGTRADGPAATATDAPQAEGARTGGREARILWNEGRQVRGDREDEQGVGSGEASARHRAGRRRGPEDPETSE